MVQRGGATWRKGGVSVGRSSSSSRKTSSRSSSGGMSIDPSKAYSKSEIQSGQAGFDLITGGRDVSGISKGVVGAKAITSGRSSGGGGGGSTSTQTTSQQPKVQEQPSGFKDTSGTSTAQPKVPDLRIQQGVIYEDVQRDKAIYPGGRFNVSPESRARQIRVGDVITDSEGRIVARGRTRTATASEVEQLRQARLSSEQERLSQEEQDANFFERQIMKISGTQTYQDIKSKTEKVTGSKTYTALFNTAQLDPKVKETQPKIYTGTVPITPVGNYASIVSRALKSSDAKSSVKALSLRGIGGESQVIVKSTKSIPTFQIGSRAKITGVSLSKLNILEDTGQIIGGATKLKIVDSGKEIIKSSATFSGKAGETSARFVKSAKTKDVIKLGVELEKPYTTARGSVNILKDKKIISSIRDLFKRNKQIQKDFFSTGKEAKLLQRGDKLIVKGEDIYTQFISGNLKGATQLKIGKKVVAKFPGRKGYTTSYGKLKELSARELKQLSKDDLIVYPNTFRTNVRSSDFFRSVGLDKTPLKRVVRFKGGDDYNKLVGVGATQTVTQELNQVSNLGARIIRGSSSQVKSLSYLPKQSVTKPVYVQKGVRTQSQNIKTFERDLLKKVSGVQFKTGTRSATATRTKSRTATATRFKDNFADLTMNKQAIAQATSYRYKQPRLTKREKITKFPRTTFYIPNFPIPRIPIGKKPDLPDPLKAKPYKVKKKKKRKASDVQALVQGFTAKALGIKKLRIT